MFKGAHETVMTRADGSKYRCYIPDPSQPLVSARPSKASLEERERGKRSKRFIKRIRKAVGRHCFTLTEGYWTYEVCVVCV